MNQLGLITFTGTGRQMIARQDDAGLWLMGQAGGWMPVSEIAAPFTWHALATGYDARPVGTCKLCAHPVHMTPAIPDYPGWHHDRASDVLVCPCIKHGQDCTV